MSLAGLNYRRLSPSSSWTAGHLSVCGRQDSSEVKWQDGTVRGAVWRSASLSSWYPLRTATSRGGVIFRRRGTSHIFAVSSNADCGLTTRVFTNFGPLTIPCLHLLASCNAKTTLLIFLLILIARATIYCSMFSIVRLQSTFTAFYSTESAADHRLM